MMKHRSIALVFALLASGCSASSLDESGDETIESQEQPIVGGQVADTARYPWIVSLWTSGGSFNCGGSLIAAKWVVTAAHCGTPGYVRVGPTLQSTKVNILRRIPHPSYSSATDENDIALLELASSVAVTPVVVNVDHAFPRDVELSGATVDLANTTAAGWGTTSQGGNLSSVLREVDLPAVTNASCNAALGGIFDTNICAGLNAGGRDACQGDSGGPLLGRGFGRDVLIGVTSWGIGCAQAGKPGVWTRVADFVPWLEQNGVPLERQSPAAVTIAALSL